MAIPFVDEEKKKMRVMGQPKVAAEPEKVPSIYAEGTPTFEMQKRQPDGIAPIVGKVVGGMADAAGAVKAGADAFSGAMMNNPIAKGVGAITNRIASDAQAQDNATGKYYGSMRGSGQLGEPKTGGSYDPPKFINIRPDRVGDASTQNVIGGNSAQAKTLGVATPDRQFGTGMQAGSGRITLSDTGESVTIDGSGNIKRFDASGNPIDALTKRITTGASANPNAIMSKTGIMTQFGPGTDPNVIARQQALTTQMDRAIGNPQVAANDAAWTKQFQARNGYREVDPMTEGLGRLPPGKRAEVITARMGLANAKEAAEGQQKLGMAGVENAKANTEISRMNAESSGKVQAADAEMKNFTIGQQKQIQELTQKRMNATPEEAMKIDSQLESMGALKREKPTVHFAKTYDAQGMPSGEEPYVFDPRTMGVTKPGGGQQQVEMLPPPDKRVKGKTYSNGRGGFAVWDGKGLVAQ